MEPLLNFENRSQLYDFLVYDFGFKVLEERYDAQNFGNFFIILSSPLFFLRYVNDRGVLTIEIAAATDPNKWFDLSLVKNFIYNKERINSSDMNFSNASRLENLNDFIKHDLDKINLLYSDNNYNDFKKQLEVLLKKEYQRKFP